MAKKQLINKNKKLNKMDKGKLFRQIRQLEILKINNNLKLDKRSLMIYKVSSQVIKVNKVNKGMLKVKLMKQN